MTTALDTILSLPFPLYTIFFLHHLVSLHLLLCLQILDFFLPSHLFLSIFILTNKRGHVVMQQWALQRKQEPHTKSHTVDLTRGQRSQVPFCICKLRSPVTKAKSPPHSHLTQSSKINPFHKGGSCVKILVTGKS